MSVSANDNVIDDVDQRILEALAENARISLKELAQAAGLSSPSASERLRRLEERGIIAGFTIDIDATALGYPLQAIVRVRPLPGQLHVVQRIIQDTPQFVECDKVTGDDCFIARLVVRSMAELDTILDKVAEKAETSTSMVKASPVKRRLPPLSRQSPEGKRYRFERAEMASRISSPIWPWLMP